MEATMTDPTITINGTMYTMTLATIERTWLGLEDHGIYTVNLDFEWRSSGQGTGHRIIDEPGDDLGDHKRGPRKGTAYGLDLIFRILETVGVDNWESLKGRQAYVLHEERGGYITGIANTYTPTTKHLIFETHAAPFKTD